MEKNRNKKPFSSSFLGEDILTRSAEVPTLPSFEEDEIISELLENQLRRRSMARYSHLPRWALW